MAIYVVLCLEHEEDPDDDFYAHYVTCSTKEKADKAKELLIKDGHPEDEIIINEDTDFDRLALSDGSIVDL